MNKRIYNQVASIINGQLKKYDTDNMKPRVTVLNTADYGKYCDKWSLYVNDEAYDLIHNHQGKAQDMFFADEVFVVDDFDHDLYIEPYNKTLFNLAVL